MRTLFRLTLLCAAVSLISGHGIPVEVYLTTASASTLMAPQTALNMTHGNLTAQGIQIAVNDSALYQEIDGWGASMTESSAYLLSLLKTNNATAYWRTLKRLFQSTKQSGDHQSVNFGVLRIPAGTSDFALTEYTYDDTPNDWNLTHFNTDEDDKYIIPVVKDILSINSHVKIIMTPWSAPAWMKSGNTLFGGTLLDSAYDAYSTYFVKFVQAYQAAGIPVYAVAVQNEPMYQPTSYAGMGMTPQNEAQFVKLLGPKFAAADLHVKIIIYDHNWDGNWFPLQVLSDSEANKYINGSSFHCYGGYPEQQGAVESAYPDKEIYLTECNGLAQWNYGFAASVTDNIKWYLRSIRNWARTILMWNYVLDYANGPTNGGCSVCGGLLTIDQSSLPNVNYNAFYFGMGHFSKFLTPGSRRAGTTVSDMSCVDAQAFANSDGSIHVGIVNSCGDQQVTIQWDGYSVEYTVPNGAVTLHWSVTGAAA